MRRFVNIVCAFMAIIAFGYVIQMKIASRKFTYAMICKDDVRGLFAGNQVMFGGHMIGKVKNLSIHGSYKDHAFLLIIQTSQKLDYQHVVATLSTDNYIVGTQSINLHWHDNEAEHDLPDINGMHQIQMTHSKLSLLYSALSDLDVKTLVDSIDHLPHIFKNIHTFTENLNVLTQSLQSSAFIDPDCQQHIKEAIDNINQTTIQMRIMFNPKTAIAVRNSIASILDVAEKIRAFTSNDLKVISNVIKTVDLSIEAFSKAPLHFLRNGLEQK